MVLFSEQPLLSIMVTVNNPAWRESMRYESPELVISFPLGFPEFGPFQLTLYGAVPPLTVTNDVPLINPKHVMFVMI